MIDQHTRETPGTGELAMSFGDLPGGPAPMPRRLGPYRLQGKLGRGGMGTVYRAVHLHLDKAVAVKVLSADRVHDPRALARFSREMKAVGRLDHPNLVRAHDAGEAAGLHFLVMELVEGVDLNRLSQLAAPLSVAEACELARQAALGLQRAHEHDLVHRDIKPSNLMLDARGVVKVLDLGIARLAGGSDDATLTGLNEVVGTVDFMAPEQGLECHQVDIRADIYSLGCALYKLLTGSAPFDAPEYESKLHKLKAHATRPVPPIRDRRPDVPEALADLLGRMLAKVPGDRPATPADVAAALAPFADGDLRRLIAVARTEASRAEATTAFAGGPNSTTEPGGPAATRPFGPDLASTEAAELDPGSSAAGPGGTSAGAKSLDDSFDNLDGPTGAAETHRLGRPVPAGWGHETLAQAEPISARTALLIAFAVVLAAGVIVGAVLALRPSRTGDPDVFESSPGPVPGKVYPLLNRPPEEIRFPRPAGSSFWSLRSEKLHVENTTLSLLGLGNSQGARRYTIAVTIDQIRWTGGSGLFFGYHREHGPGFMVYRYQDFSVVKNSRPGGTGDFWIKRDCMTIGPGDGRIHEANGIAKIPRPRDGQEHRLAITVGPAGVESVRWDDLELPELTDRQSGKRCTEADYRGKFGVSSDYCSSTFRDATYLQHRDEKP